MMEASAASVRATQRPRRASGRDSAARDSTDDLLTRFLATRDRALRNELLERYRPLARLCALQMRRRSEPLEDLEQVAMVGILKAVERFDPAFGATFKTYASATAIGELRRHYRDHSWTMHVPRWLKDLHVLAVRASDELTSELLRRPTMAEVAARLGVSVERVVEALEVHDAFRPRSISASPNDPAADQGPQLADESAAVLDNLERQWVVEHLLRRLPRREREIVTLRFFGGLTQTEIAHALGISQVHVSRLLRSSLSRLRAWSRVDAPVRPLCRAHEAPSGLHP